MVKRTGVRILRGRVELPSEGLWRARNPFEPSDGLVEIYLQPGEVERGGPDGSRLSKLQDLRDRRARNHHLRNLYSWCTEFARTGDGTGPADWNAVIDALSERELKEDLFSGAHLMPNVRLLEERDNGQMAMVATGEPFIIDTTPAVDDGSHWVVQSNGTIERREIDPEGMETLGLTIKPQRLSASADAVSPPRTLRYTIYAREIGEPGTATIAIQNAKDDQTLELRWDTGQSIAGDESLSREWARQRIDHLALYMGSGASLADAWVAATAHQYALGEGVADGGGRRPRGRTADTMGVLGGRAAIEETLQLQALEGRGEESPEGRQEKFPVAEITGVEVKAHPFEEMLASQEGGRLELADWVPHDRFMAYFPKTKGFFSLLEGGSDFVFGSGAALTGRSAAYRVKERYLERLGLSETLMKQFLNTGAVEEMAVILPDLFLIDGTEMTVVIRTGKPLLTTTALALVGILPGDGTTVKRNRRGEPVYWTRQENILVISTHEHELETVLNTKEHGTGLGQSPEFRFMLTRVPVTPETSYYLYFSDPFIRRLVGPAVKIGQLRRLHARAELEQASAGALLAKFDGNGDRLTDVAFLQSGGYMGKPVTAPGLSLDENGLSRSPLYGSAARMHSLLEQPVRLASEHEKQAYEQYLNEYNSYWRRFFDPIAIRYEQDADGYHELETFILPLIDNSLYGSLREMLPSEKEGVPLQIPIIEPEPVAMLSLNLREEAWLELIDDSAGHMHRFLGLDPVILDLLGPDIHLSIQDVDPILAIGNGELGALFGEFGGRLDSDMFWLPVMVSVLTPSLHDRIGAAESGSGAGEAVGDGHSGRRGHHVE